MAKLPVLKFQAMCSSPFSVSSWDWLAGKESSEMRPICVAALCIIAILAASCSPPSTVTQPGRATGNVPTKNHREVTLQELGFTRHQDSGATLRIHQMGAGNFDETGWCQATSTVGGFSVALPNLFNDFSMTGKAEDGIEVTMCVVGTRDERLVKFTAVRMKRADGKFKEDPLANFAEPFAKRGELKEKRDISLGEMKGIEIRVANRSSSALMRVFKATDSIYQLIMEAPAPLSFAERREDGERFVNSFTVSNTGQR